MALYDRLMMVSDDDGTWTGVAWETISGGFVVCATGASDAVTGSGISSYAWNDIGLATVESMADDETAANTCVGLALTTATSGTEVGVVSRGIFILESSSTAVVAGYPIISAGSCNYFESTTRDATGSVFCRVGKALTGASAEEKYFIGRVSF